MLSIVRIHLIKNISKVIQMNVLIVVKMENFMKPLIKIKNVLAFPALITFSKQKNVLLIVLVIIKLLNQQIMKKEKYVINHVLKQIKTAKNYILNKVILVKHYVLNVINLKMVISMMIQKEYVILNVHTKQEIMKKVKINV